MHGIKKKLLLPDGAAQPPWQFFTAIFFLGAANLEGPYTAMRMPSTTNSRISEMAIVRQPHA